MYRIPMFGPDAGRLVREDTVLPPAHASTQDELDAALPGAREHADRATGRGDADFDRETVFRMERQLVEGGASPEWARQTAGTAARRHGGDHVPYGGGAPVRASRS